jgi:hypothetical protein
MHTRTPGYTTALVAIGLFLLLPPADSRGQAAGDSCDLRPALESFGITPRVQGGRGTCSVFALTQAIEFAVAKRSGRGPRLSEEFLNWASNKATADTEDGGFFSDLWKGFQAYGVCAEDRMPYRASFDPKARPDSAALSDARSRRKAGLRLHWIKKWDPKRGVNDRELRGIRKALALGWPVSGGCLWPKRPVWNDGVLGMCPRDSVFDGHSVLLVGYRKGPGGDVFLIRNSAGPSRDGFLTSEYLKAYLNDAVWVDPPPGGRGPERD